LTLVWLDDLDSEPTGRGFKPHPLIRRLRPWASLAEC